MGAEPLGGGGKRGSKGVTWGNSSPQLPWEPPTYPHACQKSCPHSVPISILLAPPSPHLLRCPLPLPLHPSPIPAAVPSAALGS